MCLYSLHDLVNAPYAVCPRLLCNLAQAFLEKEKNRILPVVSASAARIGSRGPHNVGQRQGGLNSNGVRQMYYICSPEGDPTRRM